MIKSNGNISDAKEKIKSYFNKEVLVTINLGRNKVQCFCGKLTGIYSALFTVSPNEKSFKGKTSYSYAEYLCGKVIIKSINS